MVENITEFIKNFRERLSSPFFFSFVVAWIFFNWEVSVALIWYNSDLYPKSGDLIKFIKENTNNYNSLIYPFLSASFYTGVLRNLVSAFVAWTLKWGGNWNLRISKESNVPMSKFLAYRDLYNKANENLEKIIKDESKTIEHLDKQIQKTRETETEVIALQGIVSKQSGEINNLNFKLSGMELETNRLNILSKELVNSRIESEKMIEKINDVSFMNGQWMFRYRNASTDLFIEETIVIKDGTIGIESNNQVIPTFLISFFYYNSKEGRIIQHLSFLPETEEFKYFDYRRRMPEQVTFDGVKDKQVYFRTRSTPLLTHELIIKNDGDILSGTENGEAIVTYIRRDMKG